MADRQPLVTDSMDQTDAHSARFSGRTLREELSESPNPVSKVRLVAHHAKPTTSIMTALSSWMPEMASYCISTVSLFAIVAVVQTRDGKPLPNWPGFITVNFLVSALTSILKAGLLMPVSEAVSELKWLWFAKPRPAKDMEDFDRASRGPRGSLRLLFQHPRHLLACIAALITVASLGIDALTQLTVQPYDCLWDVSGTASVNKTNNYTAAERSGGNSNLIDVPMSRAIYKGVLSSDTDRSDIFYDCSTSNCTFEGATYYRSLAMCHSVVDISADVNAGHNFDLPSGLNTTYHGNLFATAESPPVTDDPEEGPLFAFEGLKYGNFAFRASLFPCIHTYKGLIISGNQLKHTLDSTTTLPRINISSTPYFSLAGDFPPLPGIDCTPSTTRQGSKTCAVRTLKSGKRYIVPSEEGSRRYSESDDDLRFAQSSDISFYDPVCTYTFGSYATDAIASYLRTLYGKRGHQKSVTGVWDGMGDILLMYLYNDGKSNMTIAETYMARLADAMTVQMRRNGAATNSAPILGQALRSRTCIRFEWQFLLLDVVLLVGTAGLVAVTVFMSWRNRQEMGRRAWKSSSLPLLWCGLEDSTRRRFGGMDYAGKELWEKSKVLEVMLGRAQDAEKKEPPSPRETDGESEMEAAEQEEDMSHLEGADVTDEMASSEKGRFLDSGWLVLRHERDIPASKKGNVVRRVMVWLSDYLPI